MARFMLLVLSLGLSAAPGPAAEPTGAALDNWPQWRGPLATGAAPHGDPPVTWGPDKNVRWKAAIPGRGSSTPIVWGDRVFVLTARDTGRKAQPGDVPKPDPQFEVKTQPLAHYYEFIVLCLDRATGQVRWRRTATEQVPHEGHHPSHSYAAFSPVTDGKLLYAPFGSFGIYCYDLNGKPVWKRDLGRLHTRLGWGEGGSPAVHGGTLVMNCDQEAGSFVIALDAKTGETRWKKDRDEKTSWSTPLIMTHQGRAQVILSATSKVRSYDLANGDLIWECGGQTVNVIPSPLPFGDTVICVSGYRGAYACAIPLDARGDVTDKVKWKYTRGTPYVPSALLLGDRLYFTQRNENVLTCLDARTGKPLIEGERVPGLGSLYASPSGAAGRIYFVDRDGTAVVLKAGDEVKVLATNRLDDPIDASPVIVGRQLILRSHGHVYCIEDK